MLRNTIYLILFIMYLGGICNALGNCLYLKYGLGRLTGSSSFKKLGSF